MLQLKMYIKIFAQHNVVSMYLYEMDAIFVLLLLSIAIIQITFSISCVYDFIFAGSYVCRLNNDIVLSQMIKIKKEKERKRNRQRETVLCESHMKSI